MSANASANISPLISRSTANDTFRDAVRMFIGKGKRFSVAQAEKGSGISARMIESFMAKVDSNDFRKPDLEEFLSLASFIGPEFTSEITHLADQGAFWLPDIDDTPPGVLAADATEAAAAIARRVADGDLSVADVHELRPTGRRMMAQGARLAFG